MKPYRVFKQYDHWWMYCEENNRLIALGYTIEQVFRQAAIVLQPVRVDPGPLRAL